jgi:predicted  nucleic acid-binding Zn-ribbon protein
MNRTLAEHIQDLEQRVNSISAKMMREENPRKRNDLESELRAVEAALNQYRSAFEAETRLPASSYSS